MDNTYQASAISAIKELLGRYEKRQESGGVSEEQQRIILVICDLHHYCRANDYNIDELIRMAYQLYQQEEAE